MRRDILNYLKREIKLPGEPGRPRWNTAVRDLTVTMTDDENGMWVHTGSVARTIDRNTIHVVDKSDSKFDDMVQVVDFVNALAKDDRMRMLAPWQEFNNIQRVPGGVVITHRENIRHPYSYSTNDIGYGAVSVHSVFVPIPDSYFLWGYNLKRGDNLPE